MSDNKHKSSDDKYKSFYDVINNHPIELIAYFAYFVIVMIAALVVQFGGRADLLERFCLKSFDSELKFDLYVTFFTTNFFHRYFFEALSHCSLMFVLGLLWICFAYKRFLVVFGTAMIVVIGLTAFLPAMLGQEVHCNTVSINFTAIGFLLAHQLLFSRNAWRQALIVAAMLISHGALFALSRLTVSLQNDEHLGPPSFALHVFGVAAGVIVAYIDATRNALQRNKVNFPQSLTSAFKNRPQPKRFLFWKENSQW